MATKTPTGPVPKWSAKGCLGVPPNSATQTKEVKALIRAGLRNPATIKVKVRTRRKQPAAAAANGRGEGATAGGGAGAGAGAKPAKAKQGYQRD